MLQPCICSLTVDLFVEFFVGEAKGEQRILFWGVKESQHVDLVLQVCELFCIVSFAVKSASKK